MAVPIGIFAIISATLGAIVSLSFHGWRRWGLAAIFILLAVGEIVVVERREKSETAERQRLQATMEALPSQIAKQVKEYVTNTAPPITLPPYPVNKVERMTPPGAPTGLVVFTDTSAKAAELSRTIQDFLNQQGEPPRRLPKESDIDFIVRSNNWYSQVMTKYKKDLGPIVNTFFHYLVGQKTVDPRVAELAKNPINVRGIRALATQLEAVAKSQQ
jgi:hypothetical protein